MKEIVFKDEKNIRLDNYLSSMYPLLKNSNINKMLRQNKIKVNGKKPSDAGCKLAKNDKISLYIDDSFFKQPNKSTAFLFSGKNLDIVYQDENILIVNKPSGISVIDENWQNFDTLINRVHNHYYELDNSYKLNYQLCHRLDTGTQGLIIIAKNEKAADFMTEQFKNNNIEKSYLAVVKGIPSAKCFVKKAFLTKNSKQAFVTISDKPMNELSKNIETHINLIDCYGDYSLINVGLITGRTHQIRAHLSFLGMPILGDSRYGNNNLNRQLKLKYQLLASYRIKFKEICNEKFSYLSNREFCAPKPWFVDSFDKHEF